eukprot:3755883-Prymnesium_polylepis.1
MALRNASMLVYSPPPACSAASTAANLSADSTIGLPLPLASRSNPVTTLRMSVCSTVGMSPSARGFCKMVIERAFVRGAPLPDIRRPPNDRGLQSRHSPHVPPRVRSCTPSEDS